MITLPRRPVLCWRQPKRGKREMALELTLRLKAVCEDCGFSKEEKHEGDWWGIRTDEHELIQDMLMGLEFDEGWETERASYEDMNLYCPNCKARRAAT